MLYDISLRISYDYDNAADSSRHMVRLLPADLPGEQRLIAGNLDIHPRPDELTSGMDFFWNRFSQIAFLHTHEDIDFNMHARVERYEQSTPLDISPPLERIGSDIRAQMNLGPLAPHHFLGPSPRVPQSLATAAFAHAILTNGINDWRRPWRCWATWKSSRVRSPETSANTLSTSVEFSPYECELADTLCNTGARSSTARPIRATQTPTCIFRHRMTPT